MPNTKSCCLRGPDFSSRQLSSGIGGCEYRRGLAHLRLAVPYRGRRPSWPQYPRAPGRVIGGSSGGERCRGHARETGRLRALGQARDRTDGLGRRCWPRTRHWRTRRPAMTPGTAAGPVFRSAANSGGEHAVDAGPSLKPRQLSVCRVYRIFNGATRMASARIRSTSSDGVAYQHRDGLSHCSGSALAPNLAIRGEA